MSTPLPAPGMEPTFRDLVLIAWHALLSNGYAGTATHSAPEQAIEAARHMQRAMREEGIR
ncbi:hypothetical protein [Lysobacter sp. HA35]